MPMYTVLSSWQGHCESSLGVFQWMQIKCQSAANPHSKPIDLCCEPVCCGFVIICNDEVLPAMNDRMYHHCRWLHHLCGLLWDHYTHCLSIVAIIHQDIVTDVMFVFVMQRVIGHFLSRWYFRRHCQNAAAPLSCHLSPLSVCFVIKFSQKMRKLILSATICLLVIVLSLLNCKRLLTYQSIQLSTIWLKQTVFSFFAKFMLACLFRIFYVFLHFKLQNKNNLTLCNTFLPMLCFMVGCHLFLVAVQLMFETLTHSLVDHRQWRLATADDHSIVFFSPLFPVLWYLLQLNVATTTPLFYVVHPLSFGSSLVMLTIYTALQDSQCQISCTSPGIVSEVL